MFYNPFIEVIVKWFKAHGGIIYWGWVFASGLLLGTEIIIISEVGFAWEARVLLVVVLVVWLGGAFPISRIEKRRKESKNPTNKDGSE